MWFMMKFLKFKRNPAYGTYSGNSCIALPKQTLRPRHSSVLRLFSTCLITSSSEKRQSQEDIHLRSGIASFLYQPATPSILIIFVHVSLVGYGFRRVFGPFPRQTDGIDCSEYEIREIGSTRALNRPSELMFLNEPSGSK